MTYDELTADELRFLRAFHRASADDQRDAFALLVNHPRRAGEIVQFPSAAEDSQDEEQLDKTNK